MDSYYDDWHLHLGILIILLNYKRYNPHKNSIPYLRIAHNIYINEKSKRAQQLNNAAECGIWLRTLGRNIKIINKKMDRRETKTSFLNHLHQKESLNIAHLSTNLSNLSHLITHSIKTNLQIFLPTFQRPFLGNQRRNLLLELPLPSL